MAVQEPLRLRDALAHRGRRRPRLRFLAGEVAAHARDDLVAHLLELGHLLRALDLLRVLADVLELLHRIDQVAELGDRHLAVRLASSLVQDLRGEVRLEARLLEALEPLHQRLPLGHALRRHGPQVEPLEDAVDLVGNVGSHALDVAVAHHLPQVADALLDLVARRQRLGGELVLVELGALGADQSLRRVGTVLRALLVQTRLRGLLRDGTSFDACSHDLVRGKTLLPSDVHGPRFRRLGDRIHVDGLPDLCCGTGRSSLGRDELARPQVGDPLAGDHLASRLPRRLHEDARRLGRLRHEPQLDRDEPRPCLVVKRFLHLGLAAFRR